jgi:hypothetical protein
MRSKNHFFIMVRRLRLTEPITKPVGSLRFLGRTGMFDFGCVVSVGRHPPDKTPNDEPVLNTDPEFSTLGPAGISVRSTARLLDTGAGSVADMG